MSLPKWTEERTEALINFVGDESPVSRATVAGAADSLETSERSISSKLRKLNYDVEKVSSTTSRSYTEEQENALRELLTSNSGAYTYKDIAEKFAGGEFNAKQIQGKVLSMELTEHVKPAEQKEYQRTYTEAEEAQFVKMANDGSHLEEIAEALGKSVASARGKALSLLRAEQISAIPAQKNKAAKPADPFDGINTTEFTVEELAAKIERTVKGTKAMLTRRGISASDYDGAKRAAKNAEN
tara:strand:+ start:866 stop:1588 length:723 start_codon:yes stop_codon:yes gene_type:complete